MLKHVSVGTVKRVAGLAGDAAADRETFLAGFNNIDLSEQEKERGSRNPTDLDALDVMPEDASAALTALKATLDGLTPDQRTELRAVMSIGRGDFAAHQWDAALTEAARPPDASDWRDIAEKVRLHDYLMKGLYAMNLLGKEAS